MSEQDAFYLMVVASDGSLYEVSQTPQDRLELGSRVARLFRWGKKH